MKSRWALVLILCLQGFTCDDGGAEPDAPIEQASGEAPEEAQAPRRARVSPAPAVAPAPDGTAAYEDLLALLHLADVYDPAGLFIDFGTAARLKYTIGNWNSGWQGESREGDARVSTFGKTARLYLPAASKQPMQLRFRAKPYATGALIVYVNGKTVGEARCRTGGRLSGVRESRFPPLTFALARIRSCCVRRRPPRCAARRGRSRWTGCASSQSAAESSTPPRRVAVEQISVGGVAGARFAGAWRAGRLVRRSAGRRTHWFSGPASAPRRRRPGVADRQRRLGWLDSASSTPDRPGTITRSR